MQSRGDKSAIKSEIDQPFQTKYEQSANNSIMKPTNAKHKIDGSTFINQRSTNNKQRR